MTTASPASRPLFWSNLLIGVGVLAIAAWFASWFMTPVPSWHHDVPFVALVCSVFAGTLRRNARQREAADQARQP